MINLWRVGIFVLVAGCSSAPKPPQVSLTENVDPVNFCGTVAHPSHGVITSEQPSKAWRWQFVYSTTHYNHSPEFFYAIAHADRIIAMIKPPFVSSIFAKVKSDLKRYGVLTPIDLIITNNPLQDSQVILDCIKFADEY